MVRGFTLRMEVQALCQTQGSPFEKGTQRNAFLPSIRPLNTEGNTGKRAGGPRGSAHSQDPVADTLSRPPVAK